MTTNKNYEYRRRFSRRKRSRNITNMFTHNDKSPVISEWSTEKLKREEAVYNDLINGDMPCYGRRDILIYSAICKELEKRGVIALTD